MWRHVALVRSDVSEEGNIILRLKRINELGTKLAVTSNRSMLRSTSDYMRTEAIEWDTRDRWNKGELA
jgi:hypothetical protein